MRNVKGWVAEGPLTTLFVSHNHGNLDRFQRYKEDGLNAAMMLCSTQRKSLRKGGMYWS